MTEPRKVLIVGLDAATPALVEKWVAEDRLPNIASFLSEGAWGSLESVPNRHSGPAWSTMVTGLNPGKHGIFWFTEDKPESYEYRFVNGSFRQGKAFWRILSEEGQRVGIVNVPVSYPAETVNGVFVAGLDSPGTNDPRFTYPPELRHEVVKAAGGEYFIHPALARFLIADQVDDGSRSPASIDRQARECGGASHGHARMGRLHGGVHRVRRRSALLLEAHAGSIPHGSAAAGGRDTRYL